MMRSLLIPLIACAILAVVGLVGGGDTFARLALRAGLPGVAAKLSDDPVLRGVALSQAGLQPEAVAALERAGTTQSYNLATAHALNGDYAEALLAYDALLVRNPNHADARANFALLASLYSGTKLDLTFTGFERQEREGPTVKAPEAVGGARAIGDGAESDGAATDIFTPEVKTDSGLRRVSKRFDDIFIAASDEWLTTLLDQPGKFLAARLLAEHKRRVAMGVAAPETEEPW